MESESIEEIEHTADWAIRVRAQNLSALFERSAIGMFELIGGQQRSGDRIQRPITLQGADTETLLVAWLEELLFIQESEGVMLVRSHVQMPSDTQLLAKVEFAPEASRSKEIKAVTYHNLEVQQNDKGYEVTIVFDV